MAASHICLVNAWLVLIWNGHRFAFLITPKGHYTFLCLGEDSTSPFGLIPFLPYKREDITPVSLVQADGPPLLRWMTHRFIDTLHLIGAYKMSPYPHLLIVSHTK